MDDIKVTYKAPSALQARKANPRTHSKKQIRQIAASIQKFGFTNPVLTDCNNCIVAGHGRVEAARLIGIEAIPTICLTDLTDAEIRAYVIADNRLAELAGWDREILAIELQELSSLDFDFDLTTTGFDTAEIDVLIGELDRAEENDSADTLPEMIDAPPITRSGDIWSIGKHRLICGDATDANVYAALLDGAQAQMVFTDPPYNVPIGGHVSGLGRTKHREFAMASGEMNEAEFTAFLTTAFQHLARHSDDGAIQYICMDWRHIREVVAAGREAYSELKNLCVWAKTNGGMGSLYRSQHELVFVFKAGTGPHINNVELGRHGRYRTNLWSYAGVNSFGKDRNADLALHPTVKPVALVSDAILDCSKRGGIILDAFAGSGTTLVAAEKTARRGYGIEIDPRYCDAIIRRLADTAGLQTVHVPTGKSFAEIERDRSEKAPGQKSEANISGKEASHAEGLILPH